MAKKKKNIPQYGTVTRKGVLYYRTRILDADGKQVSLYGTTCEELYDKEQEARRQVAEIIFHREHPTVAEYCEKWLLMQSAKVSPATLKGYASNMKNYIIKPLGDMYMGDQYEEVSSYVEELFEQYRPYMIWVFLATAAIWSIVMGVFFAIAHKNEDKEKARKMIVNYFVGLVVIFAILVACPYLIRGIAALVT